MNNVYSYKEIVLDVSEINTSEEFHEYLKTKLNFPDFYGMNWDAFWDVITGMVEMPDELIVNGWSNIKKSLPDDAKKFKELLELFNAEYPMCKCMINYIG